jgi:lysylphosphatidylglycerol synthetase-like protein (DUF2156 family)
MASTTLSDYSNYASSDEGIRSKFTVSLTSGLLAGGYSLSVLSLFGTSISHKFTDEPSSGLFLLSILLALVFSLMPVLFRSSSCKSNIITHVSFAIIIVILSLVIGVSMSHISFILLIILMMICMTIIRSYCMKRSCQLKDHYLFVHLIAEGQYPYFVFASAAFCFNCFFSLFFKNRHDAVPFNPGPDDAIPFDPHLKHSLLDDDESIITRIPGR